MLTRNCLRNVDEPDRLIATGASIDSLNVGGSSDAKSLDFSSMRILIVEDSWQIGIALKRLLEEWGAEVDGPVATPAEGERLASAHAPDAVLIDLTLRGGERSTKLIDLLYDRGVYVIVMSGYVRPVVLHHGAAFLEKPFTEAQLRDSFRRMVAGNA